MPQRDVRITTTFEAVDAEGNRYVIHELTTFFGAVAGTSELRTEDGDSVDPESKGVYWIKGDPDRPGIRVTSDSPNAP